MARAKVLLSLLACAVCLALAPSALTASSALAKAGPAAKPVFHPRIGPALGIFPSFTFRNGRLQPAQSASQPLTPVTYHGGQTMTGGVTVHTIYWTGGTNPFQGRPPGAPHDYIGMIEQYLTDVAARQHGNVGTDLYHRPLQRLHRGAPVRMGHDTRRHHPWRVHRPACPRRHDDRHPALPVEVRAVRLAPEHGDMHHRRPGPG